MKSALSHRTLFGIAPGNHKLRAQPTGYSVIFFQIINQSVVRADFKNWLLANEKSYIILSTMYNSIYPSGIQNSD